MVHGPRDSYLGGYPQVASSKEHPGSRFPKKMAESVARSASSSCSAPLGRDVMEFLFRVSVLRLWKRLQYRQLRYGVYTMFGEGTERFCERRQALKVREVEGAGVEYRRGGRAEIGGENVNGVLVRS